VTGKHTDRHTPATPGQSCYTHESVRRSRSTRQLIQYIDKQAAKIQTASLFWCENKIDAVFLASVIHIRRPTN